jgi:hypothetical protein
VFQNQVLGVLLLTLEPNAYSWRFLAVRGQSFTDVGSDRCVQ